MLKKYKKIDKILSLTYRISWYLLFIIFIVGASILIIYPDTKIIINVIFLISGVLFLLLGHFDRRLDVRSFTYNLHNIDILSGFIYNSIYIDDKLVKKNLDILKSSTSIIKVPLDDKILVTSFTLEKNYYFIEPCIDGIPLCEVNNDFNHKTFRSRIKNKLNKNKTPLE